MPDIANEPIDLRLEVRDERLHDAVTPNAAFTRVASNFAFTEGPIWHPDEHWLVLSDIAASVQYRWREDGLEVFRRPSNQANGNTFDPQGRIVTCEHASSLVVRHEHDGKLVRTLASHFKGAELNSPNDVVCDSRGRVWFTDPVFGRTRADLGILREREMEPRGVYRLDPDGTLARVADDFDQPNGLCLSEDEQTLFVNDSWQPAIRRFAVADDGSLSGGVVWAEVTGKADADGNMWVPDGMKIDRDGRVWCNGPNGVHVFTPGATCLGVVRMPEKSTNFCFGGAARSDLFVTASTSLYRLETRTSGPRMIPGS